MPVDFSIKQVPDAVAERLRARAERNHRSLQGELQFILEEAVKDGALDARGLLERSRARGRVDTGKSVVELIREMREERTSHVVALIARRKSKARK